MNLHQQMINLKSADQELSIYRIISCERFVNILNSHENGLVKPSMWEDPFENFILNAVVITRDGTSASIGYRDHLYGQCWSLHKETDLMWRAYSPRKDAVKVKTTIGALLSSMYTSADQFRDISCFIGRVRYLPKDEISEVFHQANILDPSGKGIAETLLVKRWAFRAEKEIRLIYFSHEKRPLGTVYSYPIDPNALFTDAVLDPRMDEDSVYQWKSKIQNAGYSNRLIQSGLYKPPEQMFIQI